MKKSKEAQQEFTVYYTPVRGGNGQTTVRAADMTAAIRKFEGEHPGAKIKSIRAN